MFRSLFCFFRSSNGSSHLDKFEPIYGLPTRSLDEWLSRNPRLKEEYEKELAARLQSQATANVGVRGGQATKTWRALARAAWPLRLSAQRVR
jgi:hypothetical protein